MSFDSPDSGTFSLRRRRPESFRTPSMISRDEFTDGDDEILESLVKTATKGPGTRTQPRERKRTRNADRKSCKWFLPWSCSSFTSSYWYFHHLILWTQVMNNWTEKHKTNSNLAIIHVRPALVELLDRESTPNETHIQLIRDNYYKTLPFNVTCT